MSGELTCRVCEVTFADVNALYLHTKAKHGKKAARGILPPRELSLGEELAAAEIAWRCGEEPPAHLKAMFPESFRAIDHTAEGE